MVDPDDLGGIGEVARLMHLSRQRADQLTRQAGFPVPLATLIGGRLWDMKAVDQWLAGRSSTPGPKPRGTAQPGEVAG